MASNGWTRREFLAVSAAVAAPSFIATAGDPAWHQRIRRWVQLNINERDARDLNVDEWVDYWTSLKADGVTLNAGGIVAFYPTKIPYHHRSDYLGNRDLFGELAVACKKRGLRVVARLDPNYAYQDAFGAHPDWFERDREGKPRTHAESYWLYRTCMFGPWYSEQIPAIIREVNSRYDVDGFFTNGWPGSSLPGRCYCQPCRKQFGELPPEPRPSDRRYRSFVESHLERVKTIWELWDKAAKEKKPQSLYIGNLGGGPRAALNLKALKPPMAWFNADHQGRSGNTPLWDAALQGRVCRAVMGRGTATIVTGAYANAQPLWRHTAKAAAEARLWLAETVASGNVPWWHWLGASTQDRRWMEVGRVFYQWHAAHSAHFENRRSLAEVALVWSQATNAFYRAEGPRVLRGADRAQMQDHFQGFVYALLQARIPFDLVHEDDLGLLGEPAAPYRAVVLPNVALLSDQQCDQLAGYLGRGGSLVATFETSLYDRRGQPRDNFGLGRVLGVTAQSGLQGPLLNSYARIEKPHPILEGLPQTGLLPGAEYRVKVATGSAEAPVLSYLPPYPAFPPEMVFPRVEKTDEPAVVLRETGAGRVAYFPGDVDRSFWRSGHQDLGRLLANTVRWAAGERLALEIAGPGLVDLFLWETEPGMALHLINYTNPALMKVPVTELFPLDAQQVRLRLSPGFQVKEVRLLAAGTVLPHRIEAGILRFEIPGVRDYEVAAILRG